MKISLNVAQYFSNVDLNAAGVEEIVRRIGSQLGAVEDVVYFGDRYKGIVVAKVVTCEKHPNVDKLQVCRIDDGGVTKNTERGDDGLVQVVCGAPNVREGLTVAWIPPGVAVPSTVDKDPFVLEAREIRGTVSNGMLASPAELAISDDHSGLLEIKPEEVGDKLMKPGTPFEQLYGLDDVVVDLENKMFTHRPDCFGILGVARELAGIQGLAFKSPDWYLNQPVFEKPHDELPLDIIVDDEKLVPRFAASVMSGVSVTPSPIWLQALLTRIGIKPINCIVDLTNYYSQLTGQPTHAYDYDKVAKLSSQTPTLVARKSKRGEKVLLLNGKTIELDDSTTVIATNKKVIGVGGVMGGSETEVDRNTNNIIIECANFDMYSIRRTSMKYGLFTDAVTRFTKGQSIHQISRVLAKIMSDVTELCKGRIASRVFDEYKQLPELPTVKFKTSFINERLGIKLSEGKVARYLKNVEFEVSTANDSLSIHPPFWRTDVHISEDILEEVGRLHGFNTLPVMLPKRDITPVSINELTAVKDKIRAILARAGANEVLTYSFVHGNLLEKVGQQTNMAIKLSNALSPDLQYYRLSLLPSLLDKVHTNIKAGHGQLALFEINKSHCMDYVDDDGLPTEEERIAFVFATDDKIAQSQYAGAPYYQAKKYLQYLLYELGITPAFEAADEYVPKLNVSKAAFAPFEPKRSAIVRNSDGAFIGEIGEFKSRVKQNLKLPAFIAGFELDVKQLLKLGGRNQYIPLSRFPSSEQDISLQVSDDVNYDSIYTTVRETLALAESEHGYQAALSAVDIYQSQGTSKKNITLRIALTHYERTLVTSEVNHLMESIAQAAHERLSAVRL